MPWGTKTRQERSYGAAWEKLRKLTIARDKGLCQMCLKEGRVTRGKDVDHIVSRAKAKQMGWSDERTESLANTQYLCRDHHLAKTEQEQGKTKRPPRPKIGPDGWPVEG
jgi:5-methylcytosine-specific restriction enzyme A